MAQTTLRDYLQETEDALSSDRIDDALANCQYILTHFPEALEAQRLLGEVYLRQERLDDAQHAFDWVLTNDPEHVIAYCDRALVSERKADLDTALDCYQQAYELSRGNSDVRNEFNKLSVQVGQQGFMLSRAGLARLYMRGDLLTQAMQEWDAVLAVSPDRLDARTGLLETFWREGLYERAEELAHQILQDVPGCLKALLLLAHIMSPQDMRQSQELLQRAEVLDPDLVMAQELFSDLMTKRPADPFLNLLKKSPARIDAARKQVADAPTFVMNNPFGSSNNEQVADAPTFVMNNPFGTSNGALDPTSSPEVYDRPTSMNAVPSWSGSETWGNDISSLQSPPESPQESTADIPIWSSGSGLFRIDSQPRQEIPDLATSSPSGSSVGPDVSSSRPSDSFAQNVEPAVSHDESQFESWQTLSQPDLSTPRNQEQESDLWSKLDKLSADLGGVNIWEGKQEGNSAEPSATPWEDANQEGEMPSPPAWLSMLTQGERRQLNGSLTPTPPPAPSDWSGDPIPSPSDPSFSSTPSMEAGFGSLPSWQDELNAQEEQTAFRWQDQLTPQEEKPLSSQPSWQDELKPTQEKSAFASQPNWQDELKPAQEKSAFASQPNWQEELKTASGESAPDEEEASFFGPEWLKSLGAASMGDGQLPAVRPSQQAPSLPPVKPPPARPEPAYESQPQLQAVHETPPEPYKPQEEPIAKSPSKAELGLHMTLEELEQSLMAQGFLPLAPNSLASIAQTQQGTPPSSPVVGPDNTQQTPPSVPSSTSSSSRDLAAGPADKASSFEWETAPVNPTAPLAPARNQEPTLSSALAEFGQFGQPSAPQRMPPAVPATPVLPAQPVEEETLWALSLHTPEPQDASAPPKSPVWNEVPTFNPEQKIETSQRPLTRSPLSSGPVFESSQIVNPSQPLSHSSPVARPEPLLENELETTMRRPAVRLQALQQQRAALSRDQAPPPLQRGRIPERAAPGKAADGGNVSAQGRLVKGYHDQLAGNYDDAMKEYRIVIKSSPELLGEIVSNVRALLRLAPNYAAGYRVLGDAYMRQGEYLQAMEAYNKALTMAKKARS